MGTFEIEVTEILSRIVEIEAQDEDEAVSLVYNQYRDGEIVLTADDFKDVSIDIFGT